jgi:hypothetical protein
MKRGGEAAEDRGRSGNVAPLLQPGDPGDTDTASLGQLLASQAGCSSPAAGMRGRRQSFPVRAQKRAKDPPRIGFVHGMFNTRIKGPLVPG